MAKCSDPNLQPNPFVTYRDPNTGLWVVIPNPNLTHSTTEVHCQESQGIKSTEKKRVSHILS